MLNGMEGSATLTIRDLYPRLSDQELREAEENFDRYIAIILRIFERLESETHQQPGPLTAPISTLGSTAPQPEASI